MRILETRAAPNPRRVRIFLAEKGLQVPCEELDLMKSELPIYAAYLILSAWANRYW